MERREKHMQLSRYRFPVGTWLIALVGFCCLLAAMQQSAAGKVAEHAVDVPVAAAEARPAEQIGDTLCASLSAVPQRECEALLALYLSTGGSEWEVRTNWLRQTSAISPCDWAGVRCDGGHVTRLILSGNKLQGRLPRLLGALPALTHLNLADNQLLGPVPTEICDLVDTVQVASVRYNQLYASNDRVSQCLSRLQPGWQTTQTVAPQRLRVTTITTDSLLLAWTPIAYRTDGGYYEISYATPLTTGAVSTYTIHGITADKNAEQYLLDGLRPGQSYRIRLRSYTPVHDAQENEQFSAYAQTAGTTRAVGDPLLVLIYFPADNDLSPYIPSVIRRVQLGTRANPNVQVAMFVDARGNHNTEVFAVANGEIRRTNLVEEHWGTDELDSTDPAVLTWFLQTARDRFPAARTVVSLMGHGSGMTPEVEGETFALDSVDESQVDGIPPLPKTIPATPGDYENRGGYLSTADFAEALAAATDNGTNPFDVVFFDQCFQGSLDVLYEFHTYARVFVASPNYAWLAAPYHRYLVDFLPTATAEALAETIITHYQASLTNAQPNVIFWVRGIDLPPIVGAVSTLADALQTAVANGAESIVAEAALRGQYVDTTQCGRGNLHLGQPDELMGAGSLARNLARAFESGDASGVNAAANSLLTALEEVHSLARTGRPSIAPDQFWNYEDTLTVVAPLLKRGMTHREMVQANVWRASIYGEAVPLQAILASNPNQMATVTSAFALAQNSHWDEFIQSWYTNPLTPTVGVRCHYMPPAIVRSPITETLALTITEGADPASDGTVVVDWTATTATDATNYWLYVRPADSIQWQVLEILPLTQTNYTVQRPTVTLAYEFLVVAQDDVGTTVAESQQVRYAAVAPPAERRIYLPVVVK